MRAGFIQHPSIEKQIVVRAVGPEFSLVAAWTFVEQDAVEFLTGFEHERKFTIDERDVART
mgnify:CR=1 FL=1